jgi:hypothetical protein
MTPTTCPHCGARLPPVADAFCPACRGPLDESPAAPDEPTPTPPAPAEAGPDAVTRTARHLRVAGWVLLVWGGAMVAAGLFLGSLRFVTFNAVVAMMGWQALASATAARAAAGAGAGWNAARVLGSGYVRLCWLVVLWIALNTATVVIGLATARPAG